jgi:hypothetical protein
MENKATVPSSVFRVIFNYLTMTHCVDDLCNGYDLLLTVHLLKGMNSENNPLGRGLTNQVFHCVR